VRGRVVLLVDEIALSGAQDDVYRSVVSWIDSGFIRGAVGRRGAVFTGLTVLSPWAAQMESERSIHALPLGLFDVWAPKVQNAVLRQVQTVPKWSLIRQLPDVFWCLLAATGGRPRDFEAIWASLARDVNDLSGVTEERLFGELFKIDPKWQGDCFMTYLLPSLLRVPFVPFENSAATRFGRDIAVRALLNADLLAANAAADAETAELLRFPAVSLRFSKHLPGSLQTVFVRLVSNSTFYELRGDGKDFEHIWVLLLQTHLMLQRRVRLGDDRHFFWPQLAAGVPLGGRTRPTGAALAMFAGTDVRESALFDEPDEKRIFEARDSTIVRSLVFDPTAEPIVMVWHDLWTPDVQSAANDPLNLGRAATLEVAWGSPALVYFSLPTHEAIDFMLLVDGIGEEKPHVYMFQCKAHTRRNLTASVLRSIVEKLDGKLNELLSVSFKDHVLASRASSR
jgi:hypothetical protein